MKKVFFFAAIIAALACSCEKSLVKKSADSDEKAEAVLNLSVDISGHGTKTAYTESQPYETKINSVSYFVFDAETGRIDKFFTTSGTTTGSVSTILGKKKVWALVNPPVTFEEIGTEDALKASCVCLGDNSVSKSSFLMSGSAEVDLIAGGSNVKIDVKRLVSRVCLNKVTVNLPASYDSVNLEYVFLANVRSYSNYGRTLSGEWQNWQGRVLSNVIDGDSVEAELDELTAHKIDETIYNYYAYEPDTPLLMYALPNSSENDPAGYDKDAKDFKTMLVAIISIEGTRYYYPVILNAAMTGNLSYSVSMTIASLGSDDPNKPVAKSALGVEINVEPWDAGSEYDEII